MTRVVQLRRCAAVSAVLRSAAAVSAVLRAMSVMKGASAIAARQLTYVVGIVWLLPAIRANVKHVMGQTAPVLAVRPASIVIMVLALLTACLTA